MNFPGYVPAAVRTHVSKILPTLTNIIDAPSGQCPYVVQEYFQEQNKTGDFHDRRFKSYLDEHRATIIEKWTQRRELERHKECLIRLAQDERMREAYGVLAIQFDKPVCPPQAQQAVLPAWPVLLHALPRAQDLEGGKC